MDWFSSSYRLSNRREQRVVTFAAVKRWYQSKLFWPLCVSAVIGCGVQVAYGADPQSICDPSAAPQQCHSEYQQWLQRWRRPEAVLGATRFRGYYARVGSRDVIELCGGEQTIDIVADAGTTAQLHRAHGEASVRFTDVVVADLTGQLVERDGGTVLRLEDIHSVVSQADVSCELDDNGGPQANSSERVGTTAYFADWAVQCDSQCQAMTRALAHLNTLRLRSNSPGRWALDVSPLPEALYLAAGGEVIVDQRRIQSLAQWRQREDVLSRPMAEDDALLVALKRGYTLTINYQDSLGADRSVAFSLQGLSRAMAFVQQY